MSTARLDTASSITSSARIADTLRSRIMEGSIAPGAAIRQDVVATELGVSRIPVRDALSRLVAEGLVVTLPNKSARARLLDRGDLQETYEIRQALEQLAISKSTELIAEKHLVEIESARVAAERAEGDPRASLIEDERFHLACYAAAESSQLLGMIERLWRITRVYRVASWSRLETHEKTQSFKEHQMIEDALRAGRAGLARELTRVHLQTTLDRLASTPYLFQPASSYDHEGGLHPHE